MKNFFFKSVAISSLIFAQAPHGLKYQATAYNSSGAVIAKQTINVRLSILEGSATGALVYEEKQKAVTNNEGLFSVVIGSGSVVAGTFNVINWGSGFKWLKTEIDVKGDGRYFLLENSKFIKQSSLLCFNNK